MILQPYYNIKVDGSYKSQHYGNKHTGLNIGGEELGPLKLGKDLIGQYNRGVKKYNHNHEKIPGIFGVILVHVLELSWH